MHYEQHQQLLFPWLKVSERSTLDFTRYQVRWRTTPYAGGLKDALNKQSGQHCCLNVRCTSFTPRASTHSRLWHVYSTVLSGTMCLTC